MPPKKTIKWAIVKDIVAGGAVLVRGNMSSSQKGMKIEVQHDVMRDGYFGNKSTDTASVMQQIRENRQLGVRSHMSRRGVGVSGRRLCVGIPVSHQPSHQTVKPLPSNATARVSA